MSWASVGSGTLGVSGTCCRLAIKRVARGADADNMAWLQFRTAGWWFACGLMAVEHGGVSGEKTPPRIHDSCENAVFLPLNAQEQRYRWATLLRLVERSLRPKASRGNGRRCRQRFMVSYGK